ncbi:MAG: DMT family transporter [Planctomycetota bacterium]|jgi:drug/metabolite transporter (DMT)-like permease
MKSAAEKPTVAAPEEGKRPAVGAPALTPGDLAALLACILMWGVSFPLLKKGVDEFFPPIALGAARHLLAAALGLGFVLAGGNLRAVAARARRGWKPLAGIVVFLVLIPNTTQNIGMKYTTASLSALIQTSAPVFTVLLAPLILKEALSRTKVTGLLIAFAASIGLVWMGRGSGEGTTTLLGNLLMVATAVSYGFAPFFSKTALRSVKPMETMALAMGLGAMILFAISFGAGESYGWVTKTSTEGWLVLAGLGLLPCFFAQYFWYTVLRRQEASRIVLFTYLIPIVGILVSFLYLGERPALHSLGLGVLVIAGVALVQWEPSRKTR